MSAPSQTDWLILAGFWLGIAAFWPAVLSGTFNPGFPGAFFMLGATILMVFVTWDMVREWWRARKLTSTTTAEDSPSPEPTK